MTGLETARATLKAIRFALDAWRFGDRDEARAHIVGMSEGIKVREDWHTPGAKPDGTEYWLDLAGDVRLIGELNPYGEPRTVSMQYREGFGEWVTLPLIPDDEFMVCQFAGLFNYREAI